MPQSSRKRVLKFSFKPFDAEKKVFQKYGALHPKDKGVKGVKSVIPSFDDPNRSKQPPSLPRKVLGSKLEGVIGGFPPKSKMGVSSGKLPLKSRNVVVNKLPVRDTSFLNKKVSSSRMVTGVLMQKEHVTSRFLSVLMGKGRLIRPKVTTQMLGRKVWGNAEEAKRLSYAQKLQLFQALLKEPLSFLEIHGRFDISKKTIRRLVKNGLITEMWGPKAIGVRFKLSNKGKIYLKELEAAAKYEPKIGEDAFIRLKHRISI